MALHRKGKSRRPSPSSLGARPVDLDYSGPIQIVYSGDVRPLSVRPSLLEYGHQLWSRRFFIGAEARSKALRSTRDYRLWKLWLVVNPMLDVALYGFLFGVLFRTSRGIENFIGYLFIGLIFMKMIMGLLTAGSGLITNSRGMIRAFSFPRASLAFSQTLRAAIDNLLPAFVALLLAFLLQWGNPPTWTIIFVVPLYIMLHIFGLGLMLIMARLTAVLPDTKVIIGIATQAWFFLSGVMFSPERFDHVPIARDFMMHNPAYIFLTAIRDTTIYGQVPDLSTWLTLMLWTGGVFISGFIYFWLAEEKYVRLA